TGDHIMQGSTVVINPPDGDMTQYLNSLRRLTNFEVKWVAPGHGFLMDDLPEIVDRLLIHRRKRELKIISAMQRLESGALGDIVTDAYDDVDEKLHALAQRSLLAHLIKLESEGRVQKCDETWGWLG
ncbi:MAG: MBL fold metallo-hydrolase, partial [Betaproteobacteria bacterium]